MPVVVKLSGALLYPPRGPYYRGLLGVLRELASEGLGVVVGGGPPAREYIRALADVGASQSARDLAGIAASRLNAYVLALALGRLSAPRVPESIDEALELYYAGRVPVMGGLQPGQSTNAVALALAEAIGARLVVNALNGVAGVYDRPPGDPRARLLKRVTTRKLREIVSGYSQTAGEYRLIDHVALGIAERSGIAIRFIDGSTPENILAAARGEDVGTLVEPG